MQEEHTFEEYTRKWRIPSTKWRDHVPYQKGNVHVAYQGVKGQRSWLVAQGFCLLLGNHVHSHVNDILSWMRMGWGWYTMTRLTHNYFDVKIVLCLYTVVEGLSNEGYYFSLLQSWFSYIYDIPLYLFEITIILMAVGKAQCWWQCLLFTNQNIHSWNIHECWNVDYFLNVIFFILLDFHLIDLGWCWSEKGLLWLLKWALSRNILWFLFSLFITTWYCLSKLNKCTWDILTYITGNMFKRARYSVWNIDLPRCPGC